MWFFIGVVFKGSEILKKNFLQTENLKTLKKITDLTKFQINSKLYLF